MTGRPVSWFERVAVIAIGVVTATLVTVAFVVQGQGWGQLCPTAMVIAVVVGLGLAWFQPWQSRRLARRLGSSTATNKVTRTPPSNVSGWAALQIRLSY